MKIPIDKFSRQSEIYKKFRPTYPIELIEYINTLCRSKEASWDCGTGNGQVAQILAKSFKKVYATDISENQLKHAPLKENIIYKVERAEKTSFPDHSFDLITIAQAIHWFDLDAFNKEVKRVLKPDGIIAVWGYGLLKINPEIDKIIADFYKNIIGGYWNKERRHIDSHYKSINFDFEEIDVQQKFHIQTQWTLFQLEGYFNSWSSIQNYMEQNNGCNPVEALIKEILKKWNTEFKQINFSVFFTYWEAW